MKYLITLATPYPVAIAEIEGLFGHKVESIGKLAILDSERNHLFDRLAYACAACQFLFECPIKELPKQMERYPWHKVYQQDFCLRLHDSRVYTEKSLAGFVWRAVKNPKVNLTNPTTKIEIFVQKGRAYAGALLKSLEKDFESRKAHLRPRLHPSSLHPKLARAMVNMTGILRGTILDPFCGSGGILIEAGLMGLTPIGTDIDKEMIKRAQENLDHYGLHYRLRQGDATSLAQKTDYIVTDLPYGRNTSLDSQLYRKFMQRLDITIQKKAVIGLPSWVQQARLISGTSLKVERSLSYYLHKSLSKKILVLNRKL